MDVGWKKMFCLVAVALIQFIAILCELSANGVDGMIASQPTQNSAMDVSFRMGLWQICYHGRPANSSFTSKDCVVYFHTNICAPNCGLINATRIAAFLNVFLSLCLSGLLWNKIGVKKWRLGFGSRRCLVFSLMQLLHNIITCSLLLVVYLKFRPTFAPHFASFAIGWCFLLPWTACLLSILVAILPAYEIFYEFPVCLHR